MKKVLLLGASGSIGNQSLDILKKDKKRFTLDGFSLGRKIERIPQILKEFPEVKYVCVQLEQDYLKLKEEYPNLSWYFGDEGLKQIVIDCPSDMVINALVGFSGLVPSLTALREDKILCLANKESLVVGGKLIDSLLKQGKGKIYPIDSEHAAIAKLLSKVKTEDVEKILITASGGAFRDLKKEDLYNVSPEMALAHPNWKMGPKITIDCATMMNKGFEVIEAKWLFGFPLEKIEILMHRESHVHSLLLLKDGTYLADISEPDMHGPIEYALYEGKVDFEPKKATRLEDFGPYHFSEFDKSRYPCVDLALRAFKTGGNACAILNGANEEAVKGFLEGKIPFLSIQKLVTSALDNLKIIANPSLRDILTSDVNSRLYVSRIVERRT